LVTEVLNVKDLVLARAADIQSDAPTNYELIEGLRCWDKTIVGYIYSNYYIKIEDYLCKNKGWPEDAKDLFQDVLIILNQKFNDKIPELRSNFYFFFFTVCRRTWLNRLRRKKKEILFDDRTFIDVMEGIEELVPCLYDVDTEEKEKLFADHFNRLDCECKKILQLRFTNAPYKRIAEEMNYENEQQARNKKHYCVSQLVKSIKSDKRFDELKK
jgi:RNA polymerase sigma factor (sigma-70 family)